MIEDIRFYDSGKKINLTIDNEKQNIPIHAVDKLYTFIELNKPLETPLKENIEIDASLCYLPYDIDVDNLDDYGDTSFNLDIYPPTDTIHKGDHVQISAKFTSDNKEKNFKNITVKFYDTDEEIYDSPTIIAAKKVTLDGIATITIYNGEQVYYTNDVVFKKGIIQDSIVNKLPIGEYKATIEFAGNKYLQSTILTTDFNVVKRLAVFTFDNEYYYGEPTESIVLSGKLKDKITNKPVKNCTIKYDFDSETYSTTSNVSGSAFFNIEIPDANKIHCLDVTIDDMVDIVENEEGEPYVDEYEEPLQDFDDDGNIIEIEDDEEIDVQFEADSLEPTNNESSDTFYEKGTDDDVVERLIDEYPVTSYEVSVYLDNDSYNVENTSTSVIINKLPTEVSVNQTIPPVNNIGKLIGGVIANYKNGDKNVKYGHIYVSFDDTDYISDAVPVSDGTYSIDIDFAKINDNYNVSSLDNPIPYIGTITQDTITHIEVEGEDTENEDVSIEVGNPIIATATVQPTISSDYIRDGMMVFVLEKDGKEIYRYGTQIDSIGRAVFFFNTSTTGVYKIRASYQGLFGYKTSESSIKNIKVEKNVI